MGTLEQEFQKIHEGGIGVSIMWLWDARLDLRLIHNREPIMDGGAQ